MRLCVVLAVLAGASSANAAGGERRLHAAQVEARSFLFNDWNKFQENYHPAYAADDDPATAWVEGAPGSGAGQWLRVKVTPMTGATNVRLRIRNGYQKSPKLFEANGRAKAISIKLLPGGQTSKHTLTDTLDWQELSLALPAGKFDAVELMVDSVYPGKKYEDLCISDVQVFVTAQTADNPAFEKARFDKIIAWKTERLAASKLFKDTNAKTLPLAPQYHVQKMTDAAAVKDSGCKWDDALCHMKNTVAALPHTSQHQAAVKVLLDAINARFKDWVSVQAVALDKRPVPRIDGICTPRLESCDGGCFGMVELPLGGAIGFLKNDQVATFDIAVQPPVADVLAKKPPECKRADNGKVFAWALRDLAFGGTKTQVRALLMVRCGAVESREGRDPTVMPQLLVYGESGQLELLVGATYATIVHWKRTQLSEAYRVSTNDEPLVLSTP